MARASRWRKRSNATAASKQNTTNPPSHYPEGRAGRNAPARKSKIAEGRALHEVRNLKPYWLSRVPLPQRRTETQKTEGQEPCHVPRGPRIPYLQLLLRAP